MDNVQCEKCGRTLLKLETYLTIGDIAVCEECAWNMTTREFIEAFGGEIKVIN